MMRRMLVTTAAVVGGIFLGEIRAASALTLVLEGNANEKVFVDTAPQLGKGAHLLKVSGVRSAWADKVMKVKVRTVNSQERYSFTYDLQLSDGAHQREYVILVETAPVMVKGSEVRGFELHLPERGDSPALLHESPSLAQTVSSLDLGKEFAAAPFQPVVE